MKIDSDLNRLELKHIVDRYPLTEDDGPLFFNSTDTAFQVTNDMFLIEEPDGVAAAFFLPGIGHKLFRMDTDLNIIETKNIGGGLLSHGNGSSAILTDDGFSVTLRFSGRAENLSIPFSELTGFSDPSVNFGLQLKTTEMTEADIEDLDFPVEPPDKDQEFSIPGEEQASDTSDTSVETKTGEVIALDAFRKK